MRFAYRNSGVGLDVACGALFSAGATDEVDPEAPVDSRSHFLCKCGETQTTLKIDNLPRIPESYAALYDLARNILDPVIEYFGAIRLTYGFCSNNLRRHIKVHVAPHLDQHAAYELNSKDELVCPRIGAAADFLVEDENMYEVVRWIHDNLEYDRMYYYGPDRPIHVSYSKTPMREITELHDRADGKRIPKRLEL